MKKFEVCIRGRNFLIKDESGTRKKSFYAARGVEARTMSEATDKAMDSLRAELKGMVVNKENDPPVTTIEEIEEVYYFQDELAYKNKHIPMTSVLWDEEEEAPQEIKKPISAWRGGWAPLKESIAKKDIHTHTMALHFANALYPVAILFMILFLIFGKESFRDAHFYTLLLATLSVPPSYLTGLLEWKKRHQGAMIPIFLMKIRYGILVFAIGATATVWHALYPGVLSDGGIPAILYILLNLSILPPLIYLGHLGGMIVYEGVD